jgi:mRNA-degrading endonuclease toxin of MazEF toxin-antitoxin module
MILPQRGDVAWLSMDPTEEREPRGHRPHVVLSSAQLAQTLGLVIAVPLTSRHRPWATRVQLAEGSYAIAERPRTVSVQRITRVEATGYDVGPIISVINTLLDT